MRLGSYLRRIDGAVPVPVATHRLDEGLISVLSTLARGLLPSTEEVAMAARTTRREEATARTDAGTQDTSRYPGGGSTTGSDHPVQDEDQRSGAGRGQAPKPPAPAERGGQRRSVARTKR